jgi:dipeptidyl-peptidase-4
MSSLRYSLLVLLVVMRAEAQSADSLTVDRIFRLNEFGAAATPTVQWLGNEANYIDVRSGQAGSEISRFDVANGRSTRLIDPAILVGDGGARIEIEELTLSKDQTRALLYHNSERVWRENTRGLYHVLELATGKLQPVSRRGAMQMFAKLSPNGRQVAFVSDNNLYLTDLSTGSERALTTDGSADIINGTTDWVYEEEFGLRDGFRWSPDGARIAFFRFDQSRVPAFSLIDETALYPRPTTFKYPKVGMNNSVVRVGVMDVATGAVRWMNTGPDSAAYLARMEWVGNDSVVIQRLPRKQNGVDFLIVSAATGNGRTLLSDSDSAYVDVHDPIWIRNDTQLLWLSDRTGWRQIFLYDRSGRVVRQLSRDGMDVTEIAGVDERNGDVYAQVAGPNPTQRTIMRYSLDGRRTEVVTPQPGWYSMSLSPGARYALVTYSRAHMLPTTTLYAVPSMRPVRVLASADSAAARLARLNLRRPEFFRVLSADGRTMLDAYRVVPPQFDSTRRHPVLIYVYGGPASPQVNDSWGGTRYLWHQLLAQKGYVVVVVDNRGAAWRGRHFRKMTQYRVGVLESDDQIAAARWIARQRWADATRVGMWGWSGGGFMTLLSTMRGGDLFKMGISVAPVTDWRLYDTIYTERYMWLPSENADGYRVTAPLNYVDGLRARLLLVHGTGDDNVHAQNTLQLVQKLQLARKPFSLMLYPNKTHSIAGAGGTIHLYDMMTRFVLENL